MEPRRTPSPSEPVRILIADDDQHARAGVGAFLTSTFNCTIVAVAGNGREAITQVVNHRPDAVVLDLHMPVLSGLEAARIIKAQWPETAIVVLTMYTEHRMAATSVGVDAFVCKGDPPATLLQALRGAVRGVGSHGTENTELRS